MAGRFLFSSSAVTRSGPHIRDANSVQRVWNYFVVASVPAWLVGIWSVGRQTNLAIAQLQLESISGWRGRLLESAGIGFDAFSVQDCLAQGLLWFLPVFLVALSVGAFWEALFARLRHRAPDDGVLAAAWFFTLLLPAGVPVYQVGLGMTFGLVIGKLIYGGSGRYLVNPALLGLAFLVLSYPSVFSGVGTWVPVKGFDQPTVIELVAEEGGLKVIAALDYTWWQLFIGDRPGAFGTTSVLGALLGAIFLILTGVASWRVMLGALGGLAAAVLAFNANAHGNTMFEIPVPWHLLLGGFAFAVIFLATDPVAGAMTNPGRWGYGLLAGALTVVIRNTSPSYYDDAMFAVLLASLFSPLVDFVVVELNIRRRRLRLQGDAHEQ
jgi:Na+-transporting NADH:ubiquinone oxidoreductase subunit B